ncbi:MAG TPA: N-formylglutamate amidohydrolase [Candidatus Krumholzibacteria bacterium]|nr:N-formylglutamate amidohydrolase [Candidatus Krumholzibacteria bacterium]
MPRRKTGIVVSCEHAGNRVPTAYRSLFRGHAGALKSHRGWDPGALDLARAVAFACHAPLLANTTTRLLVECNRSIGSAELFSEFTRDLDTSEHMRLLVTHYLPHRRAVDIAVRRALRRHERVVHIGVHTFTPVLGGKRRSADLGLLYDPSRRFEVEVAGALATSLRAFGPTLRVRRNYPYRGWTDGLTTTLRRRFSAQGYAGIEIEVNHALMRKPVVWKQVKRALADAARAGIQLSQDF